ncbi:MAG: nucleotidyltransferase family protein, partial [Fermentimonas sp.]
FFGIKKYDRLIDEKIKDIIQKNMFEKIDLDGLRVKILPVELNAFYIFYHLFHHFIHLGIGMRQLCDWTLFIKTYSADINSKSFNELVDSFDLTYAMKSFASFTVKYLGAKPEYFPFETDINNKYVDIILEDVFSGGNFGYDLFKKRTFHSELHRKWYSFRFSTKRIVKIADLAPEHIKPLPFIKLNTNLRLLVNTIKNNIRSV